MAKLPQQFDVNDPQLQSGADVIPDGQYVMKVSRTAMKETSSGGEMLEIMFTVLDGEYTGSVVFDRLNLVNSNPRAVNIAFSQLAKISKAVGLDRTPADSDELLGKPLLVTVEQEPYMDKETGVEKGKSMKIKSYAKFIAASVQKTESKPVDKPASEQPAPQQQQQPAEQQVPATESASFDDVSFDDEIPDMD